MGTVFTMNNTPVAALAYKSVSVGDLKPISPVVQGQVNRLERGRTVFRQLATRPLPTLPQFKATRVTSVNTKTKANLFYDTQAKQVYYPIRIPLPSTAAAAAASNPTVLAHYIVTLGAPVAIPNSNTTILTQAVTMPAGGGPFRVYGSYSMYLDTAASGQDAAFITDGTNNFATAEVLTTGSASDYGLSCDSFSTGTYTNGQAVTFTLKAAGTHAGNSNAHVAVGPALTGAQDSWMQIVVFASN